MMTFKPDVLSPGDIRPNEPNPNKTNWLTAKGKLLLIALILLFTSYSGRSYGQTCACTNLGSEKVNNPHFSNTCALPTLNSATNYSSDFTPMNCNTYPSSHLHFTEGPNASYIGNWGCPTSEHTGDGVGMMIFDGPIAADGDQRAWYQTGVAVTAGNCYKFNAWVANVCNACSTNHYPSFKLQVVDASGTHTLATVSLLAACSWRNMCGTYCPTTSQNVTIQILVPAPTTYTDDSGDDGAIDDITFTQMVGPDASFTVSNPQCNSPVNFTSTTSTLTHSWNFGDPGSGGSNTSTLVNPSHTFSTAGTYVVTHTVTDPKCGPSTVTQNVQITACCCTNLGQELVNNPHFSNACALPTLNPATNYGSDLTPMNCNTLPSGADHFTEGPNASYIFNWGCPTNEHTGDGVGMLIFDGPQNGDANKRVWFQTNLPVTYGTCYQFSAWVANICNSCSANHFPSFMLQVVDAGGNVTTVASINLLAPCTWTKLCGTYCPCTSGNVTIQVLVPAPAFDNSGDDGAIDDITFRAQLGSDALFTYNTPVCNGPVQFTADDASITDVHTWDFGDNSGPDASVNPLHQFPSPGTYTVTLTVSGACGPGTSVQKVTITGCPCVLCQGSNMVVNGDFAAPCTPLYSSDMTVTMPCINGVTSHDQFTETKDASLIRGNYCGRDHDGGGTNFLLVDGPINGETEKRAWFTTGPGGAPGGYPVQPGVTYCFSAELINVDFFDPENPSIKLVIKVGGQTFTVAEIDNLAANECCGWTKISGCWTAPQGVLKIDELDVVMKPVGCGPGNDVGIDDIQFGTSCSTCESNCQQQGLAPMKVNKNQSLMNIFSQPNPIDDKASKTDNSLKVNPIPVVRGNNLNLNYSSTTQTKVKVSVFDPEGKVIYEANENLTVGENQLIVKTNNFKPGSYILKTETDKEVKSTKIIVQ